MLFSSASVGPGASVRTLAPGIDIVYRFVRLACAANRCRLRFLTDRRWALTSPRPDAPRLARREKRA
jgi:hypothetical protein